MKLITNDEVLDLTIDDLKENKVVLFFYPKASTPGWTNEAKDFSVLKNDFENLGYKVYGVSKDSVVAQQRFMRRHDLQVELVSDEEGKLCKLFDVIKEKNVFGKIGLGIVRTTIVLDENLVVINRYDNVKVNEHAKTVYNDIKTLAN